MQNLNTPIATRAPYVAANPFEKAAHRAAQKSMFGAANAAGLGTGPAHKDAMIDGINSAFGLRGSQRIISRTQMTVDEQRAIAAAIESGLFGEDWIWSVDFKISRCEVQEVTQIRTVLHFAPINDARAEMFAM